MSFALGTDTAGSGRVPAALNNIVGLKPSRGHLSSRGVVPACRSLDCVSIFALSCEDAAQILDICGGYDAEDPFSRQVPMQPAAFPERFRFAVPSEADLEFFGDVEAPRLLFAAAVALAGLGGVRVMTEFAPFRAAGAMLYEGPWVAERLVAIEELYRRSPEALLPVTRRIIAAGERYSATDVFRAEHRLAVLRRAAEAVWRSIDLLLLPTAATTYAIAAIEADPIVLNARLGHYTNFVNLFGSRRDRGAGGISGGQAAVRHQSDRTCRRRRRAGEARRRAAPPARPAPRGHRAFATAATRRGGTTAIPRMVPHCGIGFLTVRGDLISTGFAMPTTRGKSRAAMPAGRRGFHQPDAS